VFAIFIIKLLDNISNSNDAMWNINIWQEFLSLHNYVLFVILTIQNWKIYKEMKPKRKCIADDFFFMVYNIILVTVF